MPFSYEVRAFEGSLGMANLKKIGAQIQRVEKQETRGRPTKSMNQLLQATINGTPGGTMVAFDRAAVQEPCVVGFSFLSGPRVVHSAIGRWADDRA